MAARANDLGQLQIIQAFHQRFENLGRNHVAHDTIVIQHRHWPPWAPLKTAEGFFFNSDTLTALSARILCIIMTSIQVMILV